MKPAIAIAIAAAAVVVGSAPTLASAANVVVDFEKQWDYLDGAVDHYYAGGTAADGSAGSNLGVSFTGVSGLSNDGDFTYYSGAPSMQGVAYVYDSRAVLDFATGAAGTLTFWYSTPVTVQSAIRAYSGLGGTGNLLGSHTLLANSSGVYDGWTSAAFTFSGVARSFALGAGADLVAFDNIGVSPVPEPSTALLMLIGGVAALRLARARAAHR